MKELYIVFEYKIDQKIYKTMIHQFIGEEG